MQTGTELAFELRGDVASWSIEFFDRGEDGRFQNELLGISYLIDGVRGYAGAGWRPNLIRTTGAMPGQQAALERIFNAPVIQGQRRCAVEFDSALLAAESPFSAPESGDAMGLSSFGDEPALPACSESLEAVAAMTAVALLEGYPKLDWVAGKLGTPRRTLQRRLNAQGANFSSVVEDILRDKAVAALRRSDRKVTEIAFALGFSDAAHFTRAFRRWTGATPDAFRRAAVKSKSSTDAPGP